jgi:hypothetical protein
VAYELFLGKSVERTEINPDVDPFCEGWKNQINWLLYNIFIEVLK